MRAALARMPFGRLIWAGPRPAKIARMLTPPDVHCPVEIIYQTLEGLRSAVPNHRGDWYFSGDYPTKGGIRLVNRAFVNYCTGRQTAR